MNAILSSPIFLLGAALLILLAVLFAVLPIVSGGSAGRRLARRRRALQELRDDLGPADYSARLDKLELEQAEAGRSGNAVRGLAGLLAVSLPLLALFLYTQVGTPEGIHPEPGPNAELREILGELTSAVRNQPENIEAWNRLGIIWKQLQQYPAAEGAFRRVIYIEPQNQFARVELAETLLYASNRPQLPEASRELLDSVLADNPDNEKALWLAGVGAFQNGETQLALDHWTHLRGLLPAGNVRQRVNEQIAQITGVSEASSASGQAAEEGRGSAGIQVAIEVDPRLGGTLIGSESVFVFARAVNGPPAPLAVKRLSASELPAVVMLSDDDSMAPGLSLSAFPQVRISARISHSGDATASPGDLQGQTGAIMVETTDRISIMIDQVVE